MEFNICNEGWFYYQWDRKKQQWQVIIVLNGNGIWNIFEHSEKLEEASVDIEGNDNNIWFERFFIQRFYTKINQLQPKKRRSGILERQ